MNTNLTALYVVIREKRVIIVDSNLKLFIEQFMAMEPASRNYQWFYRAFKKEDYFSIEIDGKEYIFQKVV